MCTRIILTGLVAIFLSCKKENDTPGEKISATELLAQKPWILASYGMDENGNAKIDPAEEGIEDCQRDNTTHFYPDGTGLFDDNTISCGTGVDKETFTWVFTDSENGIDFLYDSVKILQLNGQELTLYKDLVFSNSDTVKFILNYRH
jgi:hypothetical protein